jgi:ribonuclease G
LSPGRRAIGLSGRIADKVERARLSALVKAVAENDEGITVRAFAIGANEDQIREEVEALRADWRDISGLQRSQQPPAILRRQLPIDLRVLRDLGPSLEAAIYDHRGAADAATAWCQSAMRALAPRIQFRSSSEWRPAPAEMLEHVECAIQPRITLQAGGSILIESTEAMTVIDVNAGSASSTRVNDQGERLLLQTNLAAAEEIARQIRLRNIGGIIVVDFIDLRKVAARRQVVDRLRATAASDSAPVWIGVMSRLGLVELTRKRRGPTLMDMLTRPCPTCEGTGRVLHDDNWMRAMGAG